MSKRRASGGLTALLFLTMAGAAASLGAQTDPRTRAREVLPSETFDRLEGLVATAEAEGIPGDPLFDKAVEGVSKGVPVARILPGVEAFAGRLRTARGLLGTDVGPPVIVSGADALQKGVPPEKLTELRPAERTPMALLVLGDLIEAGVPADDALLVVRDALARGTADDAMLSIRPTVQRLLRDGRTATDAADAIRRAIRDGRPIHRVPEVGRDGGGFGAPAPPGSEPVTRDRRRRVDGSGGATPSRRPAQ